MPPTIIADPFHVADLYDSDIINEAHQLHLGLADMIDAVPRYEHSALIALARVFVGICDDMDVDPEAAFAQIADGVRAEAFEPEITEFIHDGNSTLN